LRTEVLEAKEALLSNIGAAACLAVTAPPVFCGILYDPGAYGIEVYIGRDGRKCTAVTLYQNADIAPLPECPCALVSLVITDRVALLKKFHEGAYITHTPAELFLLTICKNIKTASAPTIPPFLIQVCSGTSIEYLDTPQKLRIVKHRLFWYFKKDVKVIGENCIGEYVHTREVRRLTQDMSKYLSFPLV
jgi:hypothetical protein